MNNLDGVAHKAAAGEVIGTGDLPLAGGPEAEQRFKDDLARHGRAPFPSEHMTTPPGGGQPYMERVTAQRQDADTVTLQSTRHPVGLARGAIPGAGQPGQQVTLRRSDLSDLGQALVLPHARHPLNPSLPTNPHNPAQSRLEHAASLPDGPKPGDAISQFNGFKYRDPDLQQGVENFLAIPGVRNDPHHSITDDATNATEKSQVSHRLPGQARLAGGQVYTGSSAEVSNPEDDVPTGRTDGHNHPPAEGDYDSFQPSAADQRSARLSPHLRSFVKVPDFHKSHPDNVVVYSGAQPLRHYVSLPNDGSQPVAPDSPDSYSPGGTHFAMPPFKHPGPGYQGQIRQPGPNDQNSLSGTERDEADLYDEDV